MMKPAFQKTVAATLLGAFLSLAHAAAGAGEVTLFTDIRFSGGDMTFNSPVQDLSRIGFNDRASSIVVRSGRWELCEHANFGGECIILDRGEYADVRNMNDRISSLRQIDGRDGDERGRRRGWDGGRDGRDGDDRAWREGREDWRDGGRRDERYRGPAIEMYRKSEFRSDRRDLDDAVLRDFSAIGFNDRAQSLVIRYGQWEFCEHADFRGNCAVYGPGRHPHLGNLSSRISSVRRVR